MIEHFSPCTVFNIELLSHYYTGALNTGRGGKYINTVQKKKKHRQETVTTRGLLKTLQ